MNYAEVVGTCPDSDFELVRELLSYDSLCPVCCIFERDEMGGLIRPFIPSPLHWSRQCEWPWAIRESNIQPTDLVLDVGGGWSVLKFAIAKRCNKHLLYSVDNVQEYLDKARLAIYKLGATNICQSLMDVRDLRFNDNTFDKVFCISVLEHVPDGHMKGLREMVRVLKPGGTLMLSLDIAVGGPLLNQTRSDFFIGAKEANEVFEELKVAEVRNASRGIRSVVMGDQLVITAVMIKYTKEN